MLANEGGSYSNHYTDQVWASHLYIIFFWTSVPLGSYSNDIWPYPYLWSNSLVLSSCRIMAREITPKCLIWADFCIHKTQASTSVVLYVDAWFSLYHLSKRLAFSKACSRCLYCRPSDYSRWHETERIHLIQTYHRPVRIFWPPLHPTVHHTCLRDTSET